MRTLCARSVLLVALAALALEACGQEEDRDTPPPRSSPEAEVAGPLHVHGLGVDPADGALFVAGHTGLFRAGRNEPRAVLVADRRQDTMGFAVVGPNRFLASGHPDLREDLPPFLGLISTGDAGRTWQPVSLMGEVDFHVLEAAGARVYGFGTNLRTRQAGLLVSADGGRRWQERRAPEPLVAMAVDPRDRARIVASGEAGLHASDDGARRWRNLGPQPGLLAWSSSGPLYRAGFDGVIAESRDRGSSWRPRGRVPGEPVAFEAAGSDLYAALHDGTVSRSADGGRTWTVRLRP